MKLIEQILAEAGVDVGKAFYVSPHVCAYFKAVKAVEDYSPYKIILYVGKIRIVVSGKNLILLKYFESDLYISGDVTGVTCE